MQNHFLRTAGFHGQICTTAARLMLFAALFAVGLVGSTARAADQPDPTEKLIAILQSDAAFFEKARACQQLGERGSPAAVPALAALLGDEHLSAYARSGLEGIADPRAAAALRAALGTLHGKPLAGAVNSLGVLRDAAAVQLLQPLATNPESGVAPEALLALGHIGNAAAIQVIQRALAHGPEPTRPAAASACLLAAEQQLAGGHARTARRLYEQVQAAKVPPACRAAATRGAILARGSGGPAYLVRQLDATDPVARNMALMTIHELPSPKLEAALIAKLDQANPELQAQLLVALADFRDSPAIRAAADRTRSHDPEVRRAALATLGHIGGPGDAGTLLEALRKNNSAAESALILNLLENLGGSAVDARILKSLAEETDSANRIHLLRLVSGRGMTTATPELFRQARDADRKVSVAALGALGAVAQLKDLPELIAFTRACADESLRGTAAGALLRLCQRPGNLSAAEAPLAAEVAQAPDPGMRATWLRILLKLGSAQACPPLKQDLQGTDEARVKQAIALLAVAPDLIQQQLGAEIKPVLERLAATANDPGLRDQARAAAAGLK